MELLRVPAALFGCVSDVRRRLYDRGLFPVGRLDVPVISVGNLVAGGTGKTPFVELLVRKLQRRGLRPGIASRGYRSARRDGGGGEFHAPHRANDEARQLASSLPDVAHVQEADRLAAGRRLVDLGVDAIVLDDGFQHRRLARDLDLCLVDATRPWGLPRQGNREAVRAFLPRGLLRESPRALARADAICITRSDQVSADELARLRSELNDLAPGRAILLAAHRPGLLRRPDGTPGLPSELRGQEVDLVSGLANPAAFEMTVRSLGALVREHRRYPDHHDYADGDLDGLGGGGVPVVTTAKDAVKLEGRGVWVLEISIEVVGGGQVLEALLDALPVGRAARARRNLHEGLHG